MDKKKEKKKSKLILLSKICFVLSIINLVRGDYNGWSGILRLELSHDTMYYFALRTMLYTIAIMFAIFGFGCLIVNKLNEIKAAKCEVNKSIPQPVISMEKSVSAVKPIAKDEEDIPEELKF